MPARISHILELIVLTTCAGAAESAHGPLCEPRSELLQELDLDSHYTQLNWLASPRTAL